jgi:hypothetical protein
MIPPLLELWPALTVLGKAINGADHGEEAAAVRSLEASHARANQSKTLQIIALARVEHDRP